MVAREALAPYDHVIVLSVTAPLISPETIQNLRDFQPANKSRYDALSAVLANPPATAV